MPDNLRRKNFPFCGRLIILQSRGSRTLTDVNRVFNYEGMVAINFPAMPETIELARNTDYIVSNNPAFPDGIHQYRGTYPLELPVKFSLHSFDRDYCPKGALSLLELAAELEALTLPFGDDQIKVIVGPWNQAPAGVPGGGKPATAPAARSGTGLFGLGPQPFAAGAAIAGVPLPEALAPRDKKPPQEDSAVAKNADEPTMLTGQLAQKNYDIFPPAPCYLELIITDRTSPGIACVGYVSKVNVTLKGPWMRGPGIAQNLPTSADFTFTFMHHPGHGNAYNLAQNWYERQAFAQTVRDRLFNTHDLLTEANYHGYSDEPSK